MPTFVICSDCGKETDPTMGYYSYDWDALKNEETDYTMFPHSNVLVRMAFTCETCTLYDIANFQRYCATHDSDNE